jgi:hypothetical protein
LAFFAKEEVIVLAQTAPINPKDASPVSTAFEFDKKSCHLPGP